MLTLHCCFICFFANRVLCRLLYNGDVTGCLTMPLIARQCQLANLGHIAALLPLHNTIVLCLDWCQQ